MTSKNICYYPVLLNVEFSDSSQRAKKTQEVLFFIESKVMIKYYPLFITFPSKTT